MYTLKIKHNKRWIFLQWMLKDKTLLLCISCSICPTIYLNKHLSRLTYGRSPAKGSSPIVTRNRHITGVITYNLKCLCAKLVTLNKILYQTIAKLCNPIYKYLLSIFFILKDQFVISVHFPWFNWVILLEMLPELLLQ